MGNRYRLSIETKKKSIMLYVTGQVVESVEGLETTTRDLNNSDMQELKEMLKPKLPKYSFSDIQDAVMRLGEVAQ